MESRKIEWTKHTFNPWMWGTKVNALCTPIHTTYGSNGLYCLRSLALSS